MTKKQAVKPEVVSDDALALAPRENAEQLIARAIDKNVSVETMEKLLTMRRELKAEWSREQYHRALSLFQAECPVIKKTKKVMNKDGRTERFRYAPLDSIITQTKKLIEKHGFNYSTDAKVEGGFVTAVCTLTHRDGHSEASTFTVPIDTDAYMNEPQKVASALTFAKRYAFMDVLGVLTGDEDDDAILAGGEPTPPTPKPVGEGKHFRTKRYEEAKATDTPSDTGDLLELSKWLVDSNIPEGFVLAMLKERKLVAPNLSKLSNAPPGVIRRTLSSKDRLKKAFEASDAGASDSESSKIAHPEGKVEPEPSPLDYEKPRMETRAPVVGEEPRKILADAGYDDWRKVCVHFGERSKGKQLGKMSAKDLVWWITNWTPKPYKGKWSDKDLLLDAALCYAHAEMAEVEARGRAE